MKRKTRRLLSIVFLLLAVLLLAWRWWHVSLPERLRGLAQQSLARALDQKVTIKSVNVPSPTCVVLRGLSVMSTEESARPWMKADEASVQFREDLRVHLFGRRLPRVRSIAISHLTIRDVGIAQSHWREKLAASWRRYGRLPLACPVSIDQCSLDLRHNTKRRSLTVSHLSLSPNETRSAVLMQAQRSTLEGVGTTGAVSGKLNAVAGSALLAVVLPSADLSRLGINQRIAGTFKGVLTVAVTSLWRESPQTAFSAQGVILKGLASDPRHSAKHEFRGRLKFQVASPDKRTALGYGAKVYFRGWSSLLGNFNASILWPPESRQFHGTVTCPSVPLRTLQSLNNKPLPFVLEGGNARVALDFRGNGPSTLNLRSMSRVSCPHVIGRLTFRRATLRWRESDQRIADLAGTSSITLAGQPLTARSLDVRFLSKPGCFNALSVVGRSSSGNRWQTHIEGKGVDIPQLNRFLAWTSPGFLKRGRVDGCLDLTSSKQRSESGLGVGPPQILSGHLTFSYLDAVVPRMGCELNGAQGDIEMKGKSVRLSHGTGLVGQSVFHGEGLLTRGERRLSLRLSSDRVRIRDLTPWLVKPEQLPRFSDHTQARAVLRVTGSLKDPVVEGRVVCLSLPLNEPALGESLTTNITLEVAPSPLLHPRVTVQQQTLRLNLAEGLHEIWKRLMLEK
ncbi:MAG: hypothetical protein HY318_09380 [Armatimonadetes bacterium]|nr:hypothetical protein [Armatimonadota bacterium]